MIRASVLILSILVGVIITGIEKTNVVQSCTIAFLIAYSFLSTPQNYENNNDRD